MKKIVSLLLVVMMLAALSVTAFADNYSVSQDWQFWDYVVVTVAPADVDDFDVDVAEVAAAAGVEAVELGEAKTVTAKFAISGLDYYGPFTYKFDEAAENFLGVYFYALNVEDGSYAEPVFLASNNGEVAFPGHGVGFEVFAA